MDSLPFHLFTVTTRMWRAFWLLCIKLVGLYTIVVDEM